MYAATRMYLKNFIRRNITLYNFSEYLGSQLLQEDRTNLELLEILYETVTLTKVLRENLVIVVFTKECNLLSFIFYNFCQNLGFQPLEEDCVTVKVLTIPHGNIVIKKFLKRNPARAIFKKICILRNFAFCNFSENLGFRMLEEDWPNFQRIKIPHEIIATITKFICLEIYIRKTACSRATLFLKNNTLYKKTDAQITQKLKTI